MPTSTFDEAVARATGEDTRFVARRGFSLVNTESPLSEEDFDALALDWDRVLAEQALAEIGRKLMRPASEMAPKRPRFARRVPQRTQRRTKRLASANV